MKNRGNKGDGEPNPIFLDYNSTTPLDRRVFDAMTPYLLENFGNAGSRTHAHGKRAKDAVDNARRKVAKLLGCTPEEVIFTSGATESNNLAILGMARWGIENGKKHIISTTIEHKAILEPLECLRCQGFKVDLVPTAHAGHVEPDEVLRRVQPDTLLVTVMHANNETGVLQPIREIGEALREKGIFFHIDAAQTFGKEVEALRTSKYDLLSASAHKVYGPKGVGALFARRLGADRRPLTPLHFGGGQEMGLRPGTTPVHQVVGLGAAAELAGKEWRSRAKEANAVRSHFLEELKSADCRVNGDSGRSQPHVLNLCFPGVDSEALMMKVRDVMSISNGSACTSESYKPSHVLKAMGLTDDEVRSSVRISWGVGVTRDNLPIQALVEAVQSLGG